MISDNSMRLWGRTVFGIVITRFLDLVDVFLQAFSDNFGGIFVGSGRNLWVIWTRVFFRLAEGVRISWHLEGLRIFFGVSELLKMSWLKSKPYVALMNEICEAKFLLRPLWVPNGIRFGLKLSEALWSSFTTNVSFIPQL